jgi:hypothetical protein
MKIEPLLVRYLLQNKSVTLQHIGHFELLSLESLPQSPTDEKIDLDGTVSFHHDPKATEDVGFIRFIMEHSRKIFPLAQSDLESYAVLAKQFLNLGKPVILHGIGRLIKKQDETYVLLPAGSNPMLHDHAGIAPDIPDQREGLHAQKIDFSSPSKPGIKQNKTWPLLILIGLMGAATAFIVYYNRQDSNENNLPIADTMSNATLPAVSVQPTADSIATSTDSTHWLILGTYPSKQDAEKVKRRLIDSGLASMLTMNLNDSTMVELGLSIICPPSDTARYRDSLQRSTGFPWHWNK